MASYMLPAALLVSSLASQAAAQVIATGTMGVTNPPRPSLGAYNQTSEARLLSLNSIDDFCIFAPMAGGDTIGDQEGEVVAYCTKPRNNARLIPDGTITAAHFIKTPNYVQIQGFGDLTRLNIQQGDEGGELDPHGATGAGNPVGGNVTSNVTGSDVNYEEWMNYVAFDSFCLRICTTENTTYSAAIMCQHEIDTLGCQWVMPGDYTDNSFTSCDGDAAYPPGVYPISPASTSTFHQRYTGTFTQSGTAAAYTIGVTVTPTAAYSIPATSNCKTFSTIANGVTGLAAAATPRSSSASAARSGSSAVATGSAAASRVSAAASGARSSGAASASAAGAAATSARTSPAFRTTSSAYSVLGASVAVVVAFVGAGAVLL